MEYDMMCSQARKQAMRNLIIRIEKMEVSLLIPLNFQGEEAYDQNNIVSMVRQFNTLVEKTGLVQLKYDYDRSG